ncbi:multiheme c-type cytochrome [Thiohalomonas denitrificans]|uniref:multiheme c-type cytochrome n=1 Tax=Thiohalomonas denitrificans TaxID=415747 RepID=UPI0026E94B41|nr:multiheme c-type cytochrome [Thiohalomonas denitrificans]
MDNLVQINEIFIALAVILFVLFAIAVLAVIDQKAKIPGKLKTDAFSIAGIRQNHPIWAWLVSVFLWIIIITLAASSVYRIAREKWEPPTEEKSLFETLDKQELDETIRHFHNSPVEAPYSKGVQPVCYSCHGEFPHSAKPMVRTLLNMHTQFVGCLTCHADAEKVPEGQLRLRWLNYSGIPVSGPPFGTDVEPRTGSLVETDDYFSKIVPYRIMPDGKEALLEVTEESEQAKEFLQVRIDLSLKQQSVIKKRFHSLVNPRGRFCTRCHTSEKESYVPFRALGFSDKRISSLTNLNIVGIVQKYKNFYIPTIFHDDTDDATRETLVGKRVYVPSPTSDMKEDPRAWWRDAYDNE